MVNMIMVVLLLMFILGTKFVFGMDSYSEVSDDQESINEKWGNLEGYTKQKQDLNGLNFDNEINAYDQKNLINNYLDKNNQRKENTEQDNSLKRKHKSHKKRHETLACEFCKKECTQFRTGKFSGKSLCRVCYGYEYRYNRFVPLDERERQKHKDILACEYCKKESIRYKTGKFSGKSLCNACYCYEIKHGHFERKNIENILACECCQKQSTNYIKGKFSKKSLCNTCYMYEFKLGRYVPLNERKNGKHKDNILVCETCQKESTKFRTGKFSGKSLCGTCYDYEYRYGCFVPLDERKEYKNHKNHILVCEFCQKEDKRYMKGKLSGKSLCGTCYDYELKTGDLAERKKYENHQAILACGFCEKKNTKYITSKFTGIALCKLCYSYEHNHGHSISLNERKKYNDTKNDQTSDSSDVKKF